jgi:hypothetical protein
MNLEQVRQEILKLPDVLDVKIKKEEGLDALLEITVKNYTVDLGLRIANVVADSTWKIFEETGEFPAVEWDYKFVA